MDRSGRIVLLLWALLVLAAGIPTLVQRWQDARGGTGFDVVANLLALFVLVAGTLLVVYVARSPPLPPRQRR